MCTWYILTGRGRERIVSGFWHTVKGQWLPGLLAGLGTLLLLSAGVYAGHSFLTSWLGTQERYLVMDDVASLTLKDVSRMDLSAPTSVSVTPQMGVIAASPAGELPRPVQIRIPSIDVKRSIIEVPRDRDARTGAWSRDVSRLFRRGGRDLVGHWGGSAYPGQAGNTVLVGHNFGYDTNGVFVRLGRLKAGQKIYVVNNEGDTFLYEVDSVRRIKWRRKNLEELLQHSKYLAPDGPERLTLVTCGGANIEPFPDRIYVVAYPAPLPPLPSNQLFGLR